VSRIAREKEEKRPDFVFTNEQSDLLDEIYELVELDIDEIEVSEGEDKEAQAETKEQRKELDRLVLGFFIALLDHNTGDVESRSIFITGLAILGIDRDGGWKSPLIYTPSLSAVVTVGRMLVLDMAGKQREADVEKLVNDENMSKKKAEEAVIGRYGYVERMAQRFMGLATGKSISGPINYVLPMRTYGMKVRYNTTAGGTID
jgi:hypothetical protein